MLNKEYIKDFNVSDLIPYERNPRINDQAVDGVTKSIKRNTNIDPIEIDENNVILTGHTRLKAFNKLGIKTVDVLQITGLSEKQKKSYRVDHNKTNELADWDFDMLGEDFSMEELEDMDFDMGDFGEEEETEVVEDEAPELKEESPVKLGDIWTLGNHRLMCGDSTDAGTVALLMDGEKADIGITDPPYGIGYGGSMSLGQKKHGWTQYKGGWDEEKPNNIWLDNIKKYIDNLIVFGGNYFSDILPPSMCWLIWDKGQRDFTLADGEMAWTSFNNALRIKTISRSSALKDGKVHPTQKPIELISWCIECSERNSKKEIKSVLDLFGGSGSTLIACEQLNRKCYMMELDEHYCDVILRRWQNLTNQEAVRQDGKTYSEVEKEVV